MRLPKDCKDSCGAAQTDRQTEARLQHSRPQEECTASFVVHVCQCMLHLSGGWRHPASNLQEVQRTPVQEL